MVFTGTADQHLDSRDLLDFLRTYDPDDEEEAEVAAAIEELSDAGLEDWGHLIREDCFTDYAQELAADIGAIDPDASWPLTYIDWEAAANALRMDYTAVEFLGHTYYVRA